MWLTDESKELLRELIDGRMRMLLDWTDFLEDAGVPLHYLDGYLKCERSFLPEEHMAGLARALRMTQTELFLRLGGKASEDDKVQDEPQSIPVSETPEELEHRCLDLLEQGRKKDFDGPFNELWDLLDASNKSEERLELAARVSHLIQVLGQRAYDSSDFLGICGAYNDSRALSQSVPESREVSLTCVWLATGVFEMKFNYREFDNVDSYIDELLPVAARFPEDEAFTMQSAACLCNLLQLCPYDFDVLTSRMIGILDQIAALSERFPQNTELQLCYIRSLVFFLIYTKQFRKDEVYERFFQQTKAVLTAQQSIIPHGELSNMLHALDMAGISL